VAFLDDDQSIEQLPDDAFELAGWTRKPVLDWLRPEMSETEFYGKLVADPQVGDWIRGAAAALAYGYDAVDSEPF
jgi:hypothetical protein